MKFQRDDWLSQVMRLEVFRTLASAGQVGDATPAPDDLIAQAGGKNSFFYAKLAADELAISMKLENAGFYTVEASLVYERPVEPVLPPEKSAVTVRKAVQADRQPVTDIAAKCFTRTRFFMDPNIPHETAREIKRQWAANYFSGVRGEIIYSAGIDGRCAGFLAAIGGTDPDGKKVRYIDLVGVDPDCQGRGVGRELVRQYIADSVGRYDLLRLGTQLANIPATRLYQSTGFKIAGSQFVLHAHVRGGKVMR